MAKLIVIGEALIDFIPSSKGALSQVNSFERCPGGSVANVGAAAAKLGVESMLITKLGEDGFGDFLAEEIQKAGIDSRAITRTREAKTGLAFVSDSDGSDVEYLFYRAPAADMLLSPDDICESWFEPGDILHFCSVALVDAPCRLAHDKAIEIAREKGCLISFDVNLRPPLWDDLNELKELVLRYIPKADIVKVNDDELAFLGGDISAPHLLVTLGSEGAQYIGAGLDVRGDGFNVPVVNTTGAGDTFIGTFLAQLIRDPGLLQDAAKCGAAIRFSNAAAAVVVGRAGALGAMPTEAEVRAFLARQG